jgi:hypothetical protein
MMLPPYLSEQSKNKHLCPASDNALAHNHFLMHLRSKYVLSETGSQYHIVKLFLIDIILIEFLSYFR